MDTREFNSVDADRVDAFTRGNEYGLNIKRDIIVLSEVGGKEVNPKVIVGVAAGQPCVHVHHFIIRAGLQSRLAAEALLSYAKGILRGRGERKIIFGVSRDNMAMHNFMKSHGATELPDGIYYELEVK